LVWLFLGLTGAARFIANRVPRPVVIGIVLGLGIGFMLEGIRMMSGGWVVAALGLFGTLLLLTNRMIPAMFLLLAFGVVCGAVQHPAAWQALGAAKVGFRLPDFAPASIT